MKKSILNHEYIEQEITTNQGKEFRYRWSHGATDKHMGDGMILYSLMYFFIPKISVCLGSGNGFIPRIISSANQDLKEEGFKSYISDKIIHINSGQFWIHFKLSQGSFINKGLYKKDNKFSLEDLVILTKNLNKKN